MKDIPSRDEREPSSRDRVQHKHLKSELDMQEYVLVEFKCVFSRLVAIPPLPFYYETTGLWAQIHKTPPTPAMPC